MATHFQPLSRFRMGRAILLLPPVCPHGVVTNILICYWRGKILRVVSVDSTFRVGCISWRLRNDDRSYVPSSVVSYQADSGLQINAEPTQYISTEAIPRSTEEVYSRIHHPPDVGYLKDLAKSVSDMSLWDYTNLKAIGYVSICMWWLQVDVPFLKTGRRRKTFLRKPFSEYRGAYREKLRRRRLDQPSVTDLVRFMTAKTWHSYQRVSLELGWQFQ